MKLFWRKSEKSMQTPNTTWYPIKTSKEMFFDISGIYTVYSYFQDTFPKSLWPNRDLNYPESLFRASPFSEHKRDPAGPVPTPNAQITGAGCEWVRASLPPKDAEMTYQGQSFCPKHAQQSQYEHKTTPPASNVQHKPKLHHDGSTPTPWIALCDPFHALNSTRLPIRLPGLCGWI